jgi:Zn-finger nucleic acid-binding protein
MKCTICKQGKTTVVIKDVPADICENCGGYYLTEVLIEKVMAMAEDAVQNNVEVEVLRFAA